MTMRQRGFSLLEIIFACAIFALILAISFLPFKMLNDSFKLGGGRIDTNQEMREPLTRLVRELRTATGVTFTPDAVGAGSYRRITMTTTSTPTLSFNVMHSGVTTAVDYQCAPAGYGTGGTVTEWALVRGETPGSGTRKTRPVIKLGLTSLYFDVNWNMAPGMGYTASDWEMPTMLVYAVAYPADATRPLPDSKKDPIKLGTQVNLRNMTTL